MLIRNARLLALMLIGSLIFAGCPNDNDDEEPDVVDDVTEEDVEEEDAIDDDDEYLGTSFLLTQDEFQEMPLTMDEAVAQGWIDTEDCVPAMGIHAVPPPGDELSGAVAMAYDVDGRVTGFEVFSMEEQPTPPWEYYPDGLGEVEDEIWASHLFFRDPTLACEPDSASDIPDGFVGDQLLLTHDVLRELPLTRDEAVAAGWVDTEGCVPDMGVHLIDPEPTGDFDHFPVILVYDPDTERVIGGEFESLTEMAVPPWEHNPDGRTGFEEEHWALHFYFTDPRGICP